MAGNHYNSDAIKWHSPRQLRDLIKPQEGRMYLWHADCARHMFTDLLTKERSASSFDDIQEWIHLISAVYGQVQLGLLTQCCQRNIAPCAHLPLESCQYKRARALFLFMSWVQLHPAATCYIDRTNTSKYMCGLASLFLLSNLASLICVPNSIFAILRLEVCDFNVTPPGGHPG